MDNKLILPGMVLLAGIVFILVIIAALGPGPGVGSASQSRSLQESTGSYLAVEQEGATLQQDGVDDQVEIKNDDLLKCCSFDDKAGEDQGCYVLKNKDCSYCSSYCDLS